MKTYLIFKKAILSLVFILSAITTSAANGDIFTVTLKNNLIDNGQVKSVNIRFRVISESEKTCEVYGQATTEGSNMTVTPAIDKNVEGALTIPATVNGYKVTKVSDMAFYCCNIGSVGMPANVTYIGNNAFYKCKNLKRADIPQKVKIINTGTFSECTSMTAVTLPDSLETISGSAFSNTQLISITFPSKLKAIGISAFYGTKLTSVTFPGSLEQISSNAFAFSSLIKVFIPAGVKKIGEGVFNSCDMLRELSVSSSNTYYDSRNNCNAIINTSTDELVQGCNTTVIPSDVRKLGVRAFKGFEIKDIVIPASVRTIGGECFAYSLLESISIPEAVNTIDNKAFYSCSKLRKAYIIRGNATYTYGTQIFDACSWLGTVFIKGGYSAPNVDYSNKMFNNINTSATLYVTNTSYYSSSPWTVWFKSIKAIGGEISSFNISQFDWPDDFGADYTASSSNHTTIKKIEYYVNGTLKKNYQPKTGDNVSIYFTVEPDEGYLFTFYPTCKIGQKSFTEREGGNLGSVRFRFDYTIPKPEGGTYIKTVDETITPPSIGNAPTFYLTSSQTGKHYKVKGVNWFLFDSNGQPQKMTSASRFKTGELYFLALNLQADNGYQFDYNRTKVIINGQESVVGYVTDQASAITNGIIDYSGPVAMYMFTVQVIGDIDGNGLVNTGDVTTLYNVIFGTDTTTDRALCDLNSDGEINTTDVTVLYNIIFGTGK
ncbi:MAG: leucine-rich repeat protein [Prevotella sp.]|nr:leucine-rich repeat protein [Prevotella sp.]